MLPAAAAESLSAAALAAVLTWAVVRPRGWPEAVAAIPAAVLVIAAGALSLHDAGEEARRLGPVIGFLGAVLVLAQLCADEGLFRACGEWMARTSAGRPRRLLAHVFAVAAVTTAVLSLDATVVLLTPVVFATAVRMEARARPHLYACTHLANSASLLLPALASQTRYYWQVRVRDNQGRLSVHRPGDEDTSTAARARLLTLLAGDRPAPPLVGAPGRRLSR